MLSIYSRAEIIFSNIVFSNIFPKKINFKVKWKILKTNTKRPLAMRDDRQYERLYNIKNTWKAKNDCKNFYLLMYLIIIRSIIISEWLLSINLLNVKCVCNHTIGPYGPIESPGHVSPGTGHLIWVIELDILDIPGGFPGLSPEIAVLVKFVLHDRAIFLT